MECTVEEGRCWHWLSVTAKKRCLFTLVNEIGCASRTIIKRISDYSFTIFRIFSYKPFVYKNFAVYLQCPYAETITRWWVSPSATAGVSMGTPYMEEAFIFRFVS